MNTEEEIIISPTPEVVQFLFDCGDITKDEYLKYQDNPEYLPKLNVNHE